MTTPVSPFRSGTRPAVSLESAGYTQGSKFVATPEQAEEQERLERDVLDARNDVLDQTLGALWCCRACGLAGGGAFTARGLCHSCQTVVAQLEAEQTSGQKIGGRTRRELCQAYLARQKLS
jgi:hypothetical protein